MFRSVEKKFLFLLIFFFAGTLVSENALYAVGAAPECALRQETLFDIGCRNAHGIGGTARIVDAIYGEFSDRIVARKSDGKIMTYWMPDESGVFRMGETTTSGLLASEDGNGNCQAWSGLFRDALLLQGIAAHRISVRSKFSADSAGLSTESVMVKNWDFGAPLFPAPTLTLYEWAGESPAQSRAVTYAYIEDSVAPPAPEGTAVPAGILPGQGNPTTPKEFNAHWITKANGFYYDPSYGTQKISAQNPADYENAAFAGYNAPGASSFVRANPEECDVVFVDADADAADFSRVPADAADFAMPSPSAEDMAFVRRIAEKMKREKAAIRKKTFATRFSSPIAGASSEKILLAVRNAFAFWRVPDVCAEIDGDFYVWASGFPEQGVIADGEKSKLHSWGKGIAFGAIGRIENLEVVPRRNCLPPKNLQEEPLAAGTPEDEALIRSFVAAQAPYFFVREEKENPEKFKIQAEDFYLALTGKALLTYFRTAFSPDRAFGKMHIVCREEDGYFYVWRRGNAKRGFVVRKADRFFCEWTVGIVIRP